MSDLMIVSTILPALVALAVALEYTGGCCTRLAERLRRQPLQPQNAPAPVSVSSEGRLPRNYILAVLPTREAPPIRWAPAYPAAEDSAISSGSRLAR